MDNALWLWASRWQRNPNQWTSMICHMLKMAAWHSSVNSIQKPTCVFISWRWTVAAYAPVSPVRRSWSSFDCVARSKTRRGKRIAKTSKLSLLLTNEMLLYSGQSCSHKTIEIERTDALKRMNFLYLILIEILSYCEKVENNCHLIIFARVTKTPQTYKPGLEESFGQ